MADRSNTYAILEGYTYGGLEAFTYGQLEVTAEQFVTPNPIPSGELVYQPAVGRSVLPGTIATAEIVRQPTITVRVLPDTIPAVGACPPHDVSPTTSVPNNTYVVIDTWDPTNQSGTGYLVEWTPTWTGGGTVATEVVFIKTDGTDTSNFSVQASVASGVKASRTFTNAGVGGPHRGIKYRIVHFNGSTLLVTNHVVTTVLGCISGTVYPPTVSAAPGSQTVQPGPISSGEQVFVPTTKLQVNPNAISSGEQVYAPTILAAQIVRPNAISTAEQVYPPTVRLQVQPGTIPTAAQVPPPLVAAVQLQIVTPDAIPTAAQVYAPTLQLVLQPEAIPAGARVYAPTVVRQAPCPPVPLEPGPAVPGVPLTAAGHCSAAPLRRPLGRPSAVPLAVRAPCVTPALSPARRAPGAALKPVL